MPKEQKTSSGESKKLLFTAIPFIAILFFANIFFFKEGNIERPASPQNEQSQIILFYGDGCPHCVVVEEYIEKNNINEKISFERKEIYHNKNNASELAEKAKACEPPINSIGVPFLWDNGKCSIGDRNIIEFLKQKTGKQ
ncbi:MAG: hypothetical protein KAQ64_05390 [Candidatus Pacebacteria bacterium]|nr:hypothetical protein [Candidatus Paceibacterota bacterium]